MTHYTRNPYLILGNGMSEPDGVCYIKEVVVTDPPGAAMVGARPWNSEGYVFIGDQAAFDNLFTAVDGVDEHTDPRVAALTELGISEEIARGIIGLPSPA